MAFEYNGLIPEFYVSDFAKSLHFYQDILGFTIEYQRENPLFAFLSYGRTQLMIQEQGDHRQTGHLEYPYGRGINFQIETESVQDLMSSLEKNNYPLKRGIKDSWYKADYKLIGVREFYVMDPDGYLLRFAEGLGEKGKDE